MVRRKMQWMLVTALLLAVTGIARAEETIKVLIVDGQNNHDWQRTTPYLKQILEATGKFDVFVVTTPPRGARPQAWGGFRPQFSAYHVVLSNYNGETWPEDVRKGFEEFVSKGGGVVNVHAANNPFPDWDEWNKMIGLAWRPAAFGDRLVVDNAGAEKRVAKGEGPGAGHGPQWSYPVVVRDKVHPVMKGFPAEWLHPADELYHGQRGPALNMHLLATAFSDSGKGGTGDHEPMVWWIPYGEGKVFTTVLGHVGGGQNPETWPMRDTAFHALVTRSCEWVATGKVTIPLPDKMPTADAISLGAEWIAP